MLHGLNADATGYVEPIEDWPDPAAELTQTPGLRPAAAARAERAALLDWRRSLPRREVEARSDSVATWAREATFPVRNAAAYAAMRGEIDPSPTLTALGVRRVAYPRMVGNALEFRCPANATAMKKHRLGMTEPLPTDPPFELAEADVIFVPLALFDRRCHRIGYGGGFYDRTLAALVTHGPTSPGLSSGRRPRFIGLAHDEQCVDEWEPEAWDIGMDAVWTPTQTFTR